KLAVHQGGPIPIGSARLPQLLWPDNWLISKGRVGRLARRGDRIDLVTASVDPPAGVVERAIFREDLVDGRAPARRVVFTEDVVKIAGQQRRYAVGHGLLRLLGAKLPQGAEPVFEVVGPRDLAVADRLDVDRHDPEALAGMRHSEELARRGYRDLATHDHAGARDEGF